MRGEVVLQKTEKSNKLKTSVQMFQPGAALYFVWITCKLTSEVDETIIEKKLEPSSS